MIKNDYQSSSQDLSKCLLELDPIPFLGLDLIDPRSSYLRCEVCSHHRWTGILTYSWTLKTSFPCSCSLTSLGCSSSCPSDCAICFWTSTWILTPAFLPLQIPTSSCLRFPAPWTRSLRSPSRREAVLTPSALTVN